MKRLALSVALVTVLAGCSRDAESREDADSQAASGRAATQPAPVRAIPAGTDLTFEVASDTGENPTLKVKGIAATFYFNDSANGSNLPAAPAAPGARKSGGT
jgi:hypothetical protein